MYLKQEISTGRVLDYGCGSLNNGIFFWNTDLRLMVLTLVRKLAIWYV